MADSIFRADLFADQTIIVTGGGTGIGRAIARELAALGAFVVLAARKEEHLLAVHAEISAAGGRSLVHVCNIRDEAQVKDLFATVLEQRPRIDGLVNNAGGQFLSPAEHISRNGWHAVVETNLTGTFLMCREAYNCSLSQHGGAVVNIVSEMWRGFPGMAHSGAARAGVVNLTQTLAVEWARSGVRVNAVAPGLIHSSGLDQYGEAMRPLIDQMVQYLPAKRMGSEGEVAAAVVFLLSPAASYISGATLRVDGASSLWRHAWEIDDHDAAPPPWPGYGSELQP